MGLVPNIISKFFAKKSHVQHLQNALGFSPGKIALYEQALMHRSYHGAESELNNERLEFLGDAILGAVVGEYLYKKYPRQPEGFLTEMRSKMVNRATLNTVAVKIGLKELVNFNKNDAHLRTSQIFGNALEALIGAIYVDKGYLRTKQFILSRIIKFYMDVDAMEQEESNLKNKIIGWANRNKRTIDFVVVSEAQEGRKRFFEIGVKIDNDLICTATATSKKEASKRAAKQCLEQLGLNE